MASDSDMESVSISELESEGEDEITPRVTSKPAPSHPRHTTATQSPSSQPPPRRMTMRDRAAALREERMRREQGKSDKKHNQAALDTHDEDFEEAHFDTMNDDDMPLITPQASRRDLIRKKISRKGGSQTDDDVLIEGIGSKNDMELPRSSGARPGTGTKPGASRSGRGRKTQSRKDGTGKTASAPTSLPKLAQRWDDEPQLESNTVREDAPSHHPPLRGGAKSQKGSRAKRITEKKRKALAVSSGDGNASDENSDVVVLDTTRSVPVAGRQLKKAKLDKPKSAGSSKATNKSQSKKKTAATEQASVKANLGDTEELSSTQNAKGQAHPSSKGHKADAVSSGRKRLSEKSTREKAPAVDEDEPIVVDEIHASGSGPKSPSKAHKGTEKVLAVQPVSPVLPKRGRGRPRKSAKSDTEDAQPSTKAAGGGRQAAKAPAKVPAKVPAKASKDHGAPVSPKHSPRVSHTSKGRKGKQLVPVDLEKEQGTDDDDDIVLLQPTSSTPLTRTGSKLKKRSPPARASKGVPASQPEEVILTGEDVEMTNVPEPEDTGAGDKEEEMKDGNRSSALQSAAKKKRVSIKPGPSPRVLRPKARSGEIADAGRRQSLSHEEGLSRLTVVVDQLQHNGEAFLHTQYRVCDQLAPSSLGSQASIVSYIANGTDRKAIADASLRDAVTHAKLAYQQKQRAAISELAENLVKAMKDWKNEKNTVLRDIIPEDLRPKPATGLDDGGLAFGADNEEAQEQLKHGETPTRNSFGEDAGTGATVAPWKAHEDTGMLGNDEEMHDDANDTPRPLKIRESEGMKLMPAGFTESREEGVNMIPVMKRVDDLKKYVGLSYTKLKLGCYRSHGILKLCENVGGLTFEELYEKTPIGKKSLREKIRSLMDDGYLLGETLQGDDGHKIELFYTAPHISEKA